MSSSSSMGPQITSVSGSSNLGQYSSSSSSSTNDTSNMLYDDLERQVSQGSAAACLLLAGQLVGAGPGAGAPPSSTGHATTPFSTTVITMTPTSDDALSHHHAKAAMVCIAGIVWETASDSAASPAQLDRPTTTIGYGNSGPDEGTCPDAQLTELTHHLIQRLTSILEAPHFTTSTTSLPIISSPHHRAILVHALTSLGWSERTPSPQATIPAITSRLAAKLLSSHRTTMNRQYSTASSSASLDERALIILLGELSNAAALARDRFATSSLSTVETESAESSSYPASPETHRGEIDLEDDAVLIHDSPPTTPSHGSSSDDISSTFKPRPSPAFQQLLHERIDLRLNTTAPARNFPRTDTMSSQSSTGEESGLCTPASYRSTRSTASSILSRFCGNKEDSKSPSTVSLHSEDKSTMGAFTPFSAKTAVGSLKRFGGATLAKRSWTMMGAPKIRSRLGMPEIWSESADQSAAESDAGSLPPLPSPARPIGKRTSRIPSICLTHSSFKPESVLEPEISFTPPVLPSPKRPNFEARPISSLAKPPSPPQPRRAVTSPTVRGKTPSSAFPPLDPTFQALEKSCRLRNKVSCAWCAVTGWDFPKNKNGQALCSRECRIALKAKEMGVAPPASMGKGKAKESSVYA